MPKRAHSQKMLAVHIPVEHRVRENGFKMPPRFSVSCDRILIMEPVKLKIDS